MKEAMARPGQTLREHIRNVAEKTEQFTSEFHNGEWGRLIAELHDLGKFNPEWQACPFSENRLDELCENEDETPDPVSKRRPNHSAAGAIYICNKLPNPKYGRIFAYCIAGHHAGLPDYSHEAGIGGSLEKRLTATDELNAALKGCPPDQLPAIPKFTAPCGKKLKEEEAHLWIRMLFSSLVDADRLDAEESENPDKSALRKTSAEITALFPMLNKHLGTLSASAPDTPLNRRRKEILEQCLKKAEEAPGIFSLTVPTGGGKTLSAMAFAMKHAIKHGKKRIIMAIPYTSIIEQNAKVYKDIFGEENVLEHHSNFDPEKETERMKMASENWNMPLVVTTNVQLFESIFASSASRARKLHNLVNSVIVLDEAQMLPVEYLKPVLSVLKGLVESFGATLVLCTATQPALSGEIGGSGNRDSFKGLESVREIIDDPTALTEALRRTEVSIFNNLQASSLESIAGELMKYEQCLCIVNTRKACRTLHSLMPKETIHLSALMCPEERSKIIAEIKNKLKEKVPVRVVSTQLVEAGVDIDFPVVFRALGGIDSIAQAAGRCNREGLLNLSGKLGQVFVFAPPNPAPPGLLRQGEYASRGILDGASKIELSPALYERYFKSFFSRVNFDKAAFRDRLAKNASEFSFQFRTFASEFNLIDDSVYRPVVVMYKGSDTLIDLFKRKGPDRWLMRKLQRYSVNVPEKTVRKFLEQGTLEEICGIVFQKDQSLYQEGLGFIDESLEWNESMFNV